MHLSPSVSLSESALEEVRAVPGQPPSLSLANTLLAVAHKEVTHSF